MNPAVLRPARRSARMISTGRRARACKPISRTRSACVGGFTSALVGVDDMPPKGKIWLCSTINQCSFRRLRRNRQQYEALAKKRGKAQRDGNKTQQCERHIFDEGEPMLCQLVGCVQQKIPAEGDQYVSRGQEEQWPPQTSQLARSDSEGQQHQHIGAEQSGQEEQQDAALQRNLADDDAQPDDQSDMDLKRGGEGQAQGSRPAGQPGKDWAEQDGQRAAG